MDAPGIWMWRPLLAFAVIATAVILVVATPVGEHLGPHALDYLAGTIWAAPMLVALYIVTFGFGIPGSALFVAAGFVFDPLVATTLGALGGTSGSLLAYGIGRALGADARERWRAKRGFTIVERSVDFTGLLTLRCVPFFPHSLVNYGSGILAAPLAAFISSSVLGLSAKAFVYGRLAHSARSAAEVMDFVRLDVWGLLFALAGLSLLARVIVRRRVGQGDAVGIARASEPLPHGRG